MSEILKMIKNKPLDEQISFSIELSNHNRNDEALACFDHIYSDLDDDDYSRRTIVLYGMALSNAHLQNFDEANNCVQLATVNLSLGIKGWPFTNVPSPLLPYGTALENLSLQISQASKKSKKPTNSNDAIDLILNSNLSDDQFLGLLRSSLFSEESSGGDLAFEDLMEKLTKLDSSIEFEKNHEFLNLKSHRIRTKQDAANLLAQCIETEDEWDAFNEEGFEEVTFCGNGVSFTFKMPEIFGIVMRRGSLSWFNR